MALAVTSAPFQQVAMPALDLRRYLATLVRSEGVAAATSMLVSQRGAGANMSVDVAAGSALIQGDTVAGQAYYFAYNDAVYNLVGFAAADGTLPRVDRVALRARDLFHGDSANDVSFVILTGVATAGATLANLTGAAAVPGNHLLLANILVPAGSTSITTANIGDVRRTLSGAVRPSAGWRRGAVQSIPNAATTDILLDTEEMLRDPVYSTPSSGIITIADAGWYSVWAYISLATAPGVNSYLSVLASDWNDVIALPFSGSTSGVAAAGSTFHATAGSTVKLRVLQNTGGAVNTTAARMHLVQISRD